MHVHKDKSEAVDYARKLVSTTGAVTWIWPPLSAYVSDQRPPLTRGNARAGDVLCFEQNDDGSVKQRFA